MGPKTKKMTFGTNIEEIECVQIEKYEFDYMTVLVITASS